MTWESCLWLFTNMDIIAEMRTSLVEEEVSVANFGFSSILNPPGFRAGLCQSRPFAYTFHRTNTSPSSWPWGCYTQCSSHNRTMAFHTASRALSRLFPGIKAQGIIILINSSKSCFYTVYLYIQYIRIQFYHLFFRLHRFI